MKLFGFTLGKKDVMQVEDPKQRSFTLPNEALDDGAVTVTQNAYYGTYIDLEGSVRNELELITRYREMSNHPELEAAIDDIVNEAITHDEDGTVVNINTDKLKLPDSIKKKIHEEFNYILKLLNFSNLADDLFKRWYIDGRIYFHILVNSETPKEGIQELRYIDPRKIRKIREINKERDPVTGANVIKSIAEYYVYNDKGTTTQTYTAGTSQGLKVAADSIINVNSGLMDAKNTFVISYLHKCIVGNARIRTTTGWKYVNDIVPGDEVYSYNKITNQLEKTKVVNKWSTGVKDVVSVKSHHTELTCTNDHPILVKNIKTGVFDYLEPKDIIPKKYQICLPKVITSEHIEFPKLDRKIVCKIKYPENWIESDVQGKKQIIFDIADSLNENRNRVYAFVYGNQPLEKSVAEKIISLLPVKLDLYEKYEGCCINTMYLPEYVDEDFSRLFGFLIGDGWINPTAIGFSEGIYPELNKKYSDLMIRYFGNCTRIIANNKKSEYHTYNTNNTLGCELLKKMGFITGASKKRIPEWVFRANKEIKLAFIEGLCDADGCDRRKQYGGIWASTLNLANEKLIYDVKELWTQIGYSSGKVYSAIQKPTNINGLDVKNFSGAWSINLSKKPLKDVENIISITHNLEPQEVFDIEVEHLEHNFIANGVVVHNCIRPLNLLRMVEDAIVIYRVSRSPERRVFYIDVGNLPKGKAEQYLRDVMVKYRNKMVYDPQTGSMRDDRKHVSMLEDFFLPRREGCIHENCKITLLDGRDVTLKDLIIEYKIGKENWTYSVSPEGKVVPGKITWAGYTRKDAEIVDVHLDNGEVITVTPDHKFVLRNGLQVEAKNLQLETLLMSFSAIGTEVSYNVTKVVFREDRADVGTLTIDENHEYHDYHNFALTAGVFVMNSRGTEITTLPAGCLAMDTKVSLLDGRKLTINEIAEELKENKLWTYSCHPVTGEFAPGLISWAGITQESATVMQLTLNTGEIITCTPDHKFPIYGYGFKQANELNVGESLIAVYGSSENYSIVKIEYLKNPIQVGTLTIDAEEIYHAYHTFALSCGVMTKNSNLGETADVDYFKKKLLQSLNVPYSRLEADGGGFASMGRSAEITRDELKFSKFIVRLRNKFSQLFDEALKVQLSLKGICTLEEWEQFKEDIYFDFRKDNNFTELRESELIRERLITLQQVDPYIGRYFSQTWIKKNILRMTEEEIKDMEKEIEEDGSLEIMQQIQMQNAGMQEQEPVDNTYDREGMESPTPQLDNQVQTASKHLSL